MKQFGWGLLAGMIALAGCSEGPSSPVARIAMLEAKAGSGQTAAVGATVAVAPAVLVRGASGRPQADVAVDFAVTRGGGSVAAARAYTNVEGIATAGAWTLGPEPGANEVEARAGAASPVRFTATAVSVSEPPGPTASGGFGVAIEWVGTATVRQRAAVSAAVARWQSAVVSDLPDIPMSVPAAACFEGQPAFTRTVDDLLIFVEFVTLDGAGKVLGQAGPCYVRSETNLPVVGYLKLDAADLQMMETSGTLDDVVLHEIGHIMGIGTLWKTVGLLQGAGGEEPVFTGRQAVAAYQALGGSGGSVPVENTGEVGTRDGHWRETVFGNELMTPFISGVPNPLSALTIASLTDLGYGASASAAATYVLGGTAQHLRAPIDLRGRERIHGPKFRVDRRGRPERIDELPDGAAANGLR